MFEPTREKPLTDLPDSVQSPELFGRVESLNFSVINGQNGRLKSISQTHQNILEQGKRIGFIFTVIDDNKAMESKEVRKLRVASEKAISRHAPWGQAWLQKRALNQGIREGMNQALKKAQKEAAVAVMEPALKQSTPLAKWMSTPGKGLACPTHFESPDEHKIAWKTNPKATRSNPESRADKAEQALLHAQKYAVQMKDGTPDMRVFMHAGVQLAVATGGDGIGPARAADLVKTLCEKARDPIDGVPLAPDQLRMMVAGMVAVWDQGTCKAVSLALLEQGLALQANAPQEGQVDDGHAMASAQFRAVSEGFGIGLGWKGMAAVDEGLAGSAGKGQDPVAQALRGHIAAGQATGREWLSVLGLAMQALNGEKPNETGVNLADFYLLTKHNMGKPGSTSGTSEAQTPVPATPHRISPTPQRTQSTEDDSETDSALAAPDEEETGHTHLHTHGAMAQLTETSGETHDATTDPDEDETQVEGPPSAAVEQGLPSTEAVEVTTDAARMLPRQGGTPIGEDEITI